MFKYITFLFLSPVLLLALNSPTNLQVQALSKYSVSLDWVDNSDDEIGFKIFRNGHLLTLTDPNITHFEDTNLQPNTTYTYLVYATDYVEDELSTDKMTYKVGEKIIVNFRYLHDDVTWMAIYPIDTPDAEHAEANFYHYTDAARIGSTTWGGRTTAGMYEVRAFNDDDLKRASYAFKVEEAPKRKKLILAGGTGWLPSMTPNLIERHDEIIQLPFDGYTVVGNHFTHEVMGPNALTYDYIMDEEMTLVEGGRAYKVRELAGLYEGKDMFLLVKIKFPGDLFNDAIWSRINDNFGLIAKVAKDLGFKGISFDDEADSIETRAMINFKFPTKAEVNAPDANYAQWEINGAETEGIDEYGYRNPNFTFEEHIEMVIARYQAIMEAMVANYEDIDVLVYHGPMLGHQGTHEANHKGHTIIESNKRFYEFTGAIFTGLKRGLGESTAGLHDMGEMYKYRTDEQFARTSQWRKYDMAKNINNQTLDPSYQWRIPEVDRTNWRDKVNVGHMVFNLVEADDYPEHNTENTTHIGDIKTDISLALSFADEYAIYYCQKQEWLMPGYKADIPPISQVWKDMVRDAMLTGK